MNNERKYELRPYRDNEYPQNYQYRKSGFWDSLTDGQKKVVSSVMIGVGITAILGGAYLLATKIYHKQQALNEESKSYGKDKHATWAKQLDLAFRNDGFGTNEEAIRRIFREIPSQEDFDKVDKSYKRTHSGVSLYTDLADELSITENEEMLAIKRSKPLKAKDAVGKKIYDPKGWAIRFHAALSLTYMGFIPATDEDAIIAIFQEIPTQKAFWATGHKYYSMYSSKLWDDLDSDLDWSLDWRALLRKKPKQ